MSNKKNESVLADVTNIKSTETYTLPSKGLVYSPEEGIPASITLRRMTTREDKIRMRNESDNKIRKEILQECIMDKDVDAGKLKIMDANYLLFRLRALSLLTDTYKVGCRCKNCGTEFIDELNLSKVPVEYMTENKLKNFKVELPICKAKIDFRYPSLNDIIRMSEDLNTYMEQFPNADLNEVIYTSSSVLYIDKINGTKPILEQLEEWMDSLDILDSRAITDIIRNVDNLYGFVTDIKAKCPKCGSTVKHGLPITSELFNPSK